jgi:hypothetical protein
LEGFVFITTQGYQQWIVPKTGVYTIEANGAEGGDGYRLHGLGATMIGDFNLTVGQQLTIVVGQRGEDYPSQGGGGGGGSFVWEGASNLLIAAGGGGGGSDNNSPSTVTADIHGQILGTVFRNATPGSGGPQGAGTYWYGGGGGGWLSDGLPASGTYGEGGHSPSSDALGGLSYNSSFAEGGFGGGGGSGYDAGGGGGGYTGGTGGQYSSSGHHAGGAGSFNAGANPNNTAANHSGHGLVVITRL